MPVKWRILDDRGQDQRWQRGGVWFASPKKITCKGNIVMYLAVPVIE